MHLEAPCLSLHVDYDILLLLLPSEVLLLTSSSMQYYAMSEGTRKARAEGISGYPVVTHRSHGPLGLLFPTLGLLVFDNPSCHSPWAHPHLHDVGGGKRMEQ